MSLFDLGQSRFHQGDFQKALESLEAFCDLPDIDQDQYIEAVLMRLRIYIEAEMTASRLHLLEEAHPRLNEFGDYGLAVMNYLLGYSAFDEKRPLDGMSLLEKSLSHAIESRHHYPLFLALFGCIFISLILKKDLDQIDLKIAQLETIAQELQRAELQVSVNVIKANKALADKNGARALNYIWRAYDLVKNVKNNFLNVSIISTIGYVYLENDDKDNARIYLDLAHRMVDTANYVKLNRNVNNLRGRLGAAPISEFDLILDEHNKLLIEKTKGPIELKNQFILMSLMRLLMENPGVAFSKEELAERLWQTPYNPSVHDNTIYVTIKRARTLIEPDPQQSKYILRSRQGYHLSSGLKLAIHHQEGHL